MRIAVLTTDNRDHHRKYGVNQPYFGPAIEAVLQGLAERPNLEIHVVACTQQPMNAPDKLAGNTWFHLLHVPKIGWMRTGYQGCVRAIRRKLKELRPDVVHGQGTERECALSAAFSGFPNVATIHGNMGEVARSVGATLGSFLWCAARLEAFALRRVGGVLCNSAHTESLVRRYASRTWRVPNALRRAFFDTPLPVRPALGNRFFLVSVRSAPSNVRSNFWRWPRSFISRVIPLNCILSVRQIPVIVMRPPFSAALRRWKVRASLATAAISLLAELISAMDHASALIHAPKEEAFGLVVAEALARNLKVFAARIGGIPDIAEGVDGAHLFSLDDEAGLELRDHSMAGGGLPVGRNWPRRKCAVVIIPM